MIRRERRLYYSKIHNEAETEIGAVEHGALINLSSILENISEAGTTDV